MAIKICRAEPEYQIMRDREANTAVSSVAVTLPQEKSGDRKNVKTARILSLFSAFSISVIPASSAFHNGTCRRGLP